MTREITRGEGKEFRDASLLERFASLFRRYSIAKRLRGAFDFALWLLTAGRGLKAVLPDGEVVRLMPSCRHTHWNAEEYRAFRDATREGGTVLDIGANTGAYTLLFAQWVGPAGRVIAFEPVPEICELLRGQVVLNGLADRVEIVNAAVSESDGVAAMLAPGVVGINRVVTTAGPGHLEVATLSVDTYCGARGLKPSVIKIDVEGHELEVLRGARHTLAACPGASVFAEWHPSIWPSRGISPADLEQELSTQGLRATALRAGDDVWAVEGICARLVRA